MDGPQPGGELMNRILETRVLAPEVKYFRIEAPKVARKRKAGQFVIIRVTGTGERIPLTIVDSDPDEGWISLIVQGVGKTTRTLNELEAGDSVHDLAGPLGMASEIHEYGRAVVIGGGVGTAIAYPTAVALAEAGNDVVAIIGGRSREYVLLEDEMQEVCAEVYATTDDGSYGYHGFVTDKLAELIADGPAIDHVIAVGPIPMMRAVAGVTRPHGIDTVVSLNPIMVDGTGMCGGCRVSVGDETKFACVDGPDFDAHLVDFDLLDRRNKTYTAFEYYRNEEFTEEHIRVDPVGSS
ncbi:NADH-dependent reduced ferredoxin:NADP+ oxidoreductase subunit A [hydrothermal vent metagenome]|uniref:NADH-dependent reduced ferredoxin:NADP+ oxidoreductase subunit A n=1 Tax=hydrothermal vent metagenome TaxID=652676 RepID=A0A3B0T3G6_9ZZZZ